MPTTLEALRAAHPALGRALDRHPGLRPPLETLAAEGLLDGTVDRYLAGAGDDALDRFVRDAAACDLAWVARLRASALAPAAAAPALRLEPVTPLDLDREDRGALAAEGAAALDRGEWGAVIFAGGAATRFFTEAGDDPAVRDLVARLGAAPPKGLYPLTPVLQRCFLDRFVAEALAAGLAAGRLPPLVLMTSSQTAGPVDAWIAGDHGGFPRDLIWAMPQAEQPRLDDQGSLVARPDGALVRTGDGHGGVYAALLAPSPAGAVRDRLARLGVRSVVMHNVDNAASRPFEPSRLGAHRRGAFAFSMTVAPRAHALEKVGLVALDQDTGRLAVVEYSVCPREVAEAARPDGSPVFALAHINTNLVDLHAVRADLPRTLYTGKKVEVGGRVVPTASHEMLNQHLSGLLDPARVGVIRVRRDEFFLPTKSLRGEDSLEDTRAALSRGDAARLRAAGAAVADDATVDLDPCLGAGPDAVARRGGGRGWVLSPGSRLGLALRQGPAEGVPPLSEGLVLEPGARLVVRVHRPFGDVRYDPATRAAAEDPATAGRVAFGRGVTVAAGADVVLEVSGDGCLEVPDGARLSGRLHAVAEPGTRRVVAAGAAGE